MRHKAVHSAGTLLMWTLQRPQLIDIDDAQAPPSPGNPATLGGLLYQSSYCLALLAVVFAEANDDSSSSNSSGRSRSIGTFAAAMTQQLEHSGGRHYKLCTAPCSPILPCDGTAMVHVSGHM
jgi:hypothetical protein